MTQPAHEPSTFRQRRFFANGYLWPRLSMIFVPLSKVALGTLPPGQTGNASGIYNFLRNVGGSIGISAANTIALRQLQSHRNDPVHWYSGARSSFQQTLRKLTTLMHAHAGARRSALRALRLTDNGPNHQAQLYAYVDTFRYLALLCLICIPLAFFFKRPDPGAQGGA